MKKFTYPLLIWLLFYSAIFALLLKNSYNYLDPDLGWHLRVGEQIINERAVPDLDYFTFTLEGRSWVDHEWLSNLIMFLLYDRWGYGSLNLLFAGLIIAVLITQAWFVKKYFLAAAQGAPFIMFFQILGVLAMLPHLGVRIQEITLLFLSLLLIIIYRFRYGGKARSLIWLIPLFFFWANLHGSFLIGLFLLVLFGAYIFAARWLKKLWPSLFRKEAEFSGRKLLVFVVFASLSALATLATPYGLSLYAFLSEYTDTYYMKHIVEWLPAFYWPIQYKQLAYSALLVTASLFFIYPAFIGRRRDEDLPADPWIILISWIFLYLSFKSKRHFPLFFIVSFPFLVSAAADLLNVSEARPFKLNRVIVKTYLAAGLFLVAAYYFLAVDYTADPFRSPRFCRTYPCQAVSYMRQKPEYADLNLYNKYNWGGFMVWTWPEKRLFIDGRFPQYRFAGHSFLEEYFDFQAEEKVAEKLTQYEIGLVMLSAEQKIKVGWFEKIFLGLSEDKMNSQPDYLRDYLAANEEWKPAHEDEVAIVYEKIKN